MALNRLCRIHYDTRTFYGRRNYFRLVGQDSAEMLGIYKKLPFFLVKDEPEFQTNTEVLA